MSVNLVPIPVVAVVLMSLLAHTGLAASAKPVAIGSPVPTEDAWAAVRRSLPWDIALAPHSGTADADEHIRQAQRAVASAPDPRAQLERLGWLYVAKARASHDAGFYKLAEQCARALLLKEPENPAGLLLLGHVAQSLHRFKDAERLARQLIGQREVAYDYGLLGDALVDQGKLGDAIAAYQQMVNMKPGLQSYSRVAHVRWLKGDLSGAIETATQATRVTQSVDADSSAWAFTRLANLQTQAGAMPEAAAAVDVALSRVPDYAAALLLRGRHLLAAGQFAAAIDPLRRAAARNALPEYQWPLADALRSAGRESDAISVETEINRRGATSDPRTYAVYLATRGESADVALHLATRELKERNDVFTHDALAWVQLAAGQPAAAWESMQRALAEGTKDGRLLLHASVIASRIGRPDAREWLARAEELKATLLPSERRHLDTVQRSIAQVQ